MVKPFLKVSNYSDNKFVVPPTTNIPIYQKKTRIITISTAKLPSQ